MRVSVLSPSYSTRSHRARSVTAHSFLNSPLIADGAIKPLRLRAGQCPLLSLKSAKLLVIPPQAGLTISFMHNYQARTEPCSLYQLQASYSRPTDGSSSRGSFELRLLQAGPRLLALDAGDSLDERLRAGWIGQKSLLMLDCSRCEY